MFSNDSTELPFSDIKKLGVVGGMGPLASAAFIRTLYGYDQNQLFEQNMIPVILVSDPAIPDRTEALQAGDLKEVVNHVCTILRNLKECGATHTIFCCYSLHAFIPYLPVEYTQGLVSLIPIASQSFNEYHLRTLLLCTTGARRAKIFDTMQDGIAMNDRIVYPTEADQDRVHGIIYKYLKRGIDPAVAVQEIMELAAEYEVDSLFLGCTELHLVTPEFAKSHRPIAIIDPLYTVAEMVNKAWNAGKFT